MESTVDGGIQYGGTRLQLSPGDLLKICLVNQLPPDPAAAHWQDDGNAFLALNPTNVHTHGMLVSPRYATAADPTWGDNVFQFNFNSTNGTPEPGSNLHGTARFDVVDYSLVIPPSHPSGLDWFHPHVHGISEHQISAGLSGIITIGQISDYAIDIGPQTDSSELLISGRGTDFNLFRVHERTALPPTELARRSCI